MTCCDVTCNTCVKYTAFSSDCTDSFERAVDHHSFFHVGSLDELLHKLYLKAGRVPDWNVIRHCSGLLRKIVDSLAPAISTILVHGKVVGIVLYTENSHKRYINPQPRKKTARLFKIFQFDNDFKVVEIAFVFFLVFLYPESLTTVFPVCRI